VLLVDDHQMFREGLRAVFSRAEDIEVVGEAEDGRRAVEMARELAPDMVVMDIGMHELNGIDATGLIRHESPRIKLVMLSTYSDARYVSRALEAGASAYVLKQCAFDELLNAVRAVRAGKSYLSPEITGPLIDRWRASRAPQASPAEALGPREREVLQLLAEGKTSSEIGERLHLSTRTVETHRRNIMRKLGLHSVAELTKYAVREGITAA